MADPLTRAISPASDASVTPPPPPRRVNRPSVRQSEVTRAIRGAKDAGIEISRVEIEGRKIVLVAAGNPSERVGENEWNEVLHK